jgi:hypothetical protein
MAGIGGGGVDAGGGIGAWAMPWLQFNVQTATNETAASLRNM